MKRNIIIGLIAILITSVLLLADVTYKEYKVKKGETFMSICEIEIADCDANWKQFLEFNGLKKPTDVVEGMTLKIPNSLSKYRYAKIQFLTGDVVIFSDLKSDKGEKVKNNHVLVEKNILKTGENGKCEIKLDDGTVVKVSEDTILMLGEINFKDGASNTVLNLVKGSALMKVSKLGDGDSFNVSTPTAVAGVRGTEFTMTVGSQDKLELNVLEGVVAAGSKNNEEIIFSKATGFETTSAAEVANQTGEASLNNVISVSKGYTVILDKNSNKVRVTKVPDKIIEVKAEEVNNN